MTPQRARARRGIGRHTPQLVANLHRPIDLVLDRVVCAFGALRQLAGALQVPRQLLLNRQPAAARLLSTHLLTEGGFKTAATSAQLAPLLCCFDEISSDATIHTRGKGRDARPELDHYFARRTPRGGGCGGLCEQPAAAARPR